jgi:hypothetical protein
MAKKRNKAAEHTAKFKVEVPMDPTANTENLQVGLVDPAMAMMLMNDVGHVIIQELSDKVKELEERVRALEGR